MAICQNVSPKHKKLCAGDLIHQIKVAPQALVSPISDAVDFTKVFTDVDFIWASIDTPRGKQIFDGTNPDQGDITHTFGVYYDSSFTTEDVVFFEDRIFTIVDVNDFQERHEWMFLSCIDRGISTNPVNT